MSLDVYLYTEPCEHCGSDGRTLFDQNITHNLNRMADAAGIYQACWRPEEIGVERAEQLTPLLEAGLFWLRNHQEEARKHDAPNGWGLYEHFVPWVERYLEACKEYPKAKVRVSR